MRPAQVSHRRMSASFRAAGHRLIVIMHEQGRLVRQDCVPDVEAWAPDAPGSKAGCDNLGFRGGVRDTTLSFVLPVDGGGVA